MCQKIQKTTTIKIYKWNSNNNTAPKTGTEYKKTAKEQNKNTANNKNKSKGKKNKFTIQ